MKHKFVKHDHKITESLELSLEEKWTYIHYAKDGQEKTAFILKNEQKSVEETIEKFLKENQVSEKMRKDVGKYLKNDKKIAGFLKNRLKYFKYDSNKTRSESAENAQEEHAQHYPIIHVTIEEVRKALRTFSEQLPKGVYRSILVKEDNEIDFTQLVKILGGIPSEKFYMSKETYDLFTEDEKVIPFEMDIVQRAVDLYVKEQKKFPVLEFDPERKINYYQLIQEHFLKLRPTIQFYLTDLDGLITHIKPTIKGMG